MAATRPAVAALLIAAFLCVRVMGLHLHLCLDGTEAPVSVESQMEDDVFDDIARQAASPQVAMQDVDIDLVGDILTKLAKAASNLPILIVAVALYFLRSRQTAAYGRARKGPSTSRSRPPRIRPPLRAPPR